MKNVKSYLIICCIVGLYLNTTAQDTTATATLKRFGVGISFGSPDFLTINGMYILPALQNRLVVGITGGCLKINPITSYEWGVNFDYYMKHAGKGFFAGVQFERSILKLPNENESIDGNTYSISYRYFYRYYNFYAGYTCVWNKFYATPQLGLTYVHTDNYEIENIAYESLKIKLSGPNDGFKTTSFLPLIRLAFGYKF